MILNSLNSFFSSVDDLRILNSSSIFVLRTVTLQYQTPVQLAVVSTVGAGVLASSFDGAPEERVHNKWAIHRQESRERTFSTKQYPRESTAQLFSFEWSYTFINGNESYSHLDHT